jgi:uncharacterized protein YkwD
MIWIDVLIVAAIIAVAVRGFQRGFIVIALDLIGFIIAGVAAYTISPHLSPWLVANINTLPTFAHAAGFGLIFATIQIFYSLLLMVALRRLPIKVLTSHLNHWAGVVANELKLLLVLAVSLIVFSGLPIGSSTKSRVTDAYIPRLILQSTSGAQRVFNERFGNKLAATINFLTVKQENEERIELGFTTTNVQLREDLENQMLMLVNRERTSRGLRALTINEKAREVARAYSRDMFARGFFSHIDPEGRSPFKRMEEGGVEFIAAGENLALAPTLIQAHTGLMNSPGHRANILTPDYGTVGIGVVDGGPYGLMITQNFTN